MANTNEFIEILRQYNKFLLQQNGIDVEKPACHRGCCGYEYDPEGTERGLECLLLEFVATKNA